MGLLARTALFSALVATLVLFKETRALAENLALGRETLRLGTSTGRWDSEPSVTDGDLSSCPQYASTDFRLNFDQNTGFSWIRIVGQSGTDLPELRILRSSMCESGPVVVRERHIQDWFCDTGMTATTVDFRSTTRAHICEILIYAGSAANVALRKPATQSSTFDGTDIYQTPQLTYRAAAGLAVDGAPTKEYKDMTCAVTDWLRAPAGTDDPWWQVDLGASYDVIRVDIYGRSSANFPGLAVTVGGQAEATVPMTWGVFLPGFLTPPVTASNVNISLSGFGILQLCEVEVFALKDCPGNTYGLNCEKSCSATCRNGSCNAFNGACLLGCEPGYTGPDCTSDVDECLSSSCSSHGTCQNTPGSFSCTCDPGYTGQLCDTEIDECDSGPCQNGGTCQDLPNRYVCSCRQGYTGMNCEADINECASSPCENGATCENLRGSFRCKCISGFTGRLCETDINECSSGPCQNWATCQDLVNGYNCQCRAGFTGVHCETDIDECESHPCQNNATCRDAVNRYSCRCWAGFEGTHCEINIDECASNPCRFGTCEDGINGYTCVCAPGFQGQFCNQGCGNWTFGVNCRETCGDGCLGSCDRRNGSCSGGCSVGWTGLSCRDECSQGTYGALCAQRCSVHCLETAGAQDQHCHHQTGKCLRQTGCKPGFQGPFCSQPEGSNMGLIAGILVCAILVIAGVIIAFVWVYRRKKGRENSEPNSEELAPENKEKAAGLKKSLVSLRDKGVARYNPSAAASSTLITVAQLPQVVNAARSNPDHFKDDQLKLPKGLQHPHKVAMKEQNKGKNRYKNICAYDHSRVVLPALPDQPHSDYINACFIDGYKKPGAFIASQGPTDANVSDFIRMIWVKKVQNIAMVTMPTEEGKMKCVQYWSDTGGKTFGNFTVLVESTVARQHFTARTLHIKPKQGMGRRVAHFLYTAWPDKDVPESPWSLIDFRDKVMTSPNKRGSPILVHCSAGVGRTGTLIALDILLRQLTQEGTVDVYNTVWTLRQNRVDMVQTLAQYTFLHEAALVGVCSGGRVVPLEIFTSDPVANIKSKIIEEFKALEQTTQPLHPEECSLATMSENRAANRDPDILPPDSHVTWLTEEWEGYTKYLNGIVVSNYEGHKRYILTQTPLPDTVVNFWRVVLQFKVKVIITLDSTQPDLKERVGTYVPVDQRSLQVGPLTLTGLEAERNQGYSVRSIHVALDDDKPEIVHEFLVSCWPEEEDAPGDPGQLLGMAQTVLGKTPLKDDAILIHCRDGARRSGLLCALLALLERCRSDGEVAVPHAVGVLKTVRPQAVATEEQYAFLYAAMLRYAESSQIYQNHTPDQQADQPETQGAEDLYGNAEMLKQ